MRVPLYSVKPNAGPQAPPMAAATQERRLLAVACRPMLGRGGGWCVGCPSDLLQLFAQHTAESGFIEVGRGQGKILSQGLVHHGLIASAVLLGTLAKRFQHLVINVDRDPRLAVLREDGAAFPLPEIVFVFHTLCARFGWPGGPK
jgi:hypothetical protein